VFNEFHYQVRGRAHERDGTPGQDRTTYLSRAGIQAMCLADGAGSASKSTRGAQAAADEGCVALTELFDSLVTSNDADQSRREILNRLHARLAEVARRLDCSLSDLASTFLAVAVSEDAFVAVHIGDGVIGYLKHGELRVVSAPDNDEFANQTTFLTSESAADSMRLFRGSLDGVSGFLLMSDGTSASLYDYRTRELAPACVKLIDAVCAARTRQIKNPEHKKVLRHLIDTRVRQATRDDCSIGILGRRL